MESAHGRGRRQPQSSASHRRDPDLDPNSAKESRSTPRTNPHGGTSGSKTSPTQPSPWTNDSGAPFKLGDVVSRLGQPNSGEVPPKPRRPNDVTTRPKQKKEDDANRPKQSKDDLSSRSKSSKGDTAKPKSHADDRLAPPTREEKPRRSKDKQNADGTKSASSTPKNKRRARSSSRPRDTPQSKQDPPSRQLSHPSVQGPPTEEGGSEQRRASIPVIRLFREDSQRQNEVKEVTNELDERKDKKRRRMSALFQAKLAFEKVAMAVTEAEPIEEPLHKSEKPAKNRKARSQSAPRELKSSREAKNQGKKKSHTRHLSRDIDIEKERQKDFPDEGNASLSMQQQVPKQQHRKTDANRKQDNLEGELSLEGSSLTVSPSTTSVSSSKKSSGPFKLFHSITKSSGQNSSSKVSPPPRQPTPSRPRKKFSRGHIDQDPLEVDYEILDDRVASIEPRRSIPYSAEARRSITMAESRSASAEEPLLARHRESDPKLKGRARDSQTKQPATRPATMPYMQRTKEDEQDLYSSSTDRNKSRRATASTSSDRARLFTTHQLNTPDSVFSSIPKVSSQSSFASSDARSEVCLDLPDDSDHVESDLHLRESERDNQDLTVKLGFPNAPYRRIVHYTQFSICFAIFSTIFIFLVSFVLVWPLLVIIIFIVPAVVLIKRLCSCLCCCSATLWGRCCICMCHTHLTSSELLWLGRGAVGSSCVVQSLLVLQKGLDTDRIRNLIDSRLLSIENRHGRKIYPRFTQKVVTFCCGQAWVTDKHFMISKHVFNMPGYIETLEDLQHFISKMAGEPLSLDQPLWEIQVLHNFREPRDTVLLFRMHLCMTDGISLVHLLEHALVDAKKSTHHKSSFSKEVTNTSPFKVLFSGPFTFLSKYLCGGKDFNLLHGRHVHPSGELVVAWSEPFSLSAAMRVKQVARCTLSELLLSITAGNLRTYLQVSGISNPFNVRCAIPIDFQALDSGTLDMENKYSVVVLQLPTNIEGAIPRLWEIKYKMGRFKSSAEAAIVNGARWLTCCLFPVSFFQRLWRKIYSRCTLLIANLAGPTSVLKLDSREIKCMMYWVPPVDKIPITISFISYADQIRMAVISDRSVMPNPDLLTRDFNHKLEILSKLLAHRRIPGESASSNRHENVHLLSSFTLEDLTAEQIQLEMSLVQQELHDLKVQLDSGPTNHISHNDTQLMVRIEALKERSRELMMHLRKRKADESENAVILSEEDDLESEIGGDKPQKPFRRRTLSMSSKMSTASVSSTARPLSTASTSNLPSPIHTSLPSWPEGDTVMEELDDSMMNMQRNIQPYRSLNKNITSMHSPVDHYADIKGRYHSFTS